MITAADAQKRVSDYQEERERRIATAVTEWEQTISEEISTAACAGRHSLSRAFSDNMNTALADDLRAPVREQLCSKLVRAGFEVTFGYLDDSFVVSWYIE